MHKEYITIADLSGLPPGTCRSVELRDAGVALFNVEGDIFALDNTCPHAGGPLGEGTLEGPIVTCPWHGWKFNVCTGQWLKTPNPRWMVPKYPVRVVDGAIQITLPTSVSNQAKTSPESDEGGNS